MTPDDLIAFEKDIAELFEQGRIKAPCHLVGGNEKQLINIFKDIQPADWVFSNHRSHYHALLKGIPAIWLREEILAGHSITINNRDYRFFSSAIVGGILPIALGVAMSGQTVWAFVGDMAAKTGIYYECLQYARGHDLPIRFVVENNGLSVKTPTAAAWGSIPSVIEEDEYYSYKSQWPHQGASEKRVIF